MKTVPGFPNYEACPTGRLFRKAFTSTDGRSFKYKELSTSKIKGKYKNANMRRDGESFHYPLHYVIAWTFLGERPLGYVVDHKDRDTKNNTVDNLRYVTKSANRLNSGHCGLVILDKKTERELGVFESYQEAADFLGWSKASTISDYANGYQKSRKYIFIKEW